MHQEARKPSSRAAESSGSGLEVEQDPRFQKREMIFERVGWLAFLLFLIAAGLGAFGSGPLSSASVRDETGSIAAIYQRVGRRHVKHTLEFTVDRAESNRPMNERGSGASTEVAIALEQAYLNEFELVQIMPEPERVESQGGRQQFIFNVPGDRATITFTLEPKLLGSIHCRAQLDEGASLAFKQFFFP